MYFHIVITFLFFFLNDCGGVNEVQNSLQPRIVGGRNATTKEEFPYVVLVVQQPVNETKTCTGTILSKRFILTAGHCISNRSNAELSVWAGSHIRFGRVAVIRNVQDKWIHPGYLYKFHREFDIGIIKIFPALQFSSSIKKVKIPMPGSVLPVGTKGVFVGFGLLQMVPTEIKTTFLQALELTTISLADCKKEPRHRTICASAEPGIITPGKAVCKGDSGAPFMVGEYQWGMAVTGYTNCTGHDHAWFNDISRFTKWIKKKIQRNR